MRRAFMSIFYRSVFRQCNWLPAHSSNRLMPTRYLRLGTLRKSSNVSRCCSNINLCAWHQINPHTMRPSNILRGLMTEKLILIFKVIFVCHASCGHLSTWRAIVAHRRNSLSQRDARQDFYWHVLSPCTCICRLYRCREIREPNSVKRKGTGTGATDDFCILCVHKKYKIDYYRYCLTASRDLSVHLWTRQCKVHILLPVVLHFRLVSVDRNVTSGTCGILLQDTLCTEV